MEKLYRKNKEMYKVSKGITSELGRPIVFYHGNRFLFGLKDLGSGVSWN